MIMQEEWRDIKGYEGLYQASSFGRVRTVEGKTTFSQKHGVRHWKSRIMKGRGNNPVTGARVSLWRNGKKKDFLVARIIAYTFLGEPEDGFTVNHIDGNRLNNKVENLEWLSLADNIRHGFETGLYTSQKPVILTKGNVEYRFRSMAQCDEFLGRGHGYTSLVLKRGGIIKDTTGIVYKCAIDKSA